MNLVVYSMFIALLLAGCRAPSENYYRSLETSSSIESFIPASRLQAIKSVLPKVAFPKLQQIFASPDTFWYDHEVMKPAYQDSTGFSGVGANDNWFDLIAAPVAASGNKIYDQPKKRWHFPFATTAGTDHSTNVKVVNFISLPKKDGKLLSIPIKKVKGLRKYKSFVPGLSPNQTADDYSAWDWVYPVGTVVGELIFIQNGSELLPTEVRIRTRYESTWAANVYRPFITATQLAQAIKAKRSNYASNAQLQALVNHLENSNTLTSKTLKATGLPGTFEQSGALDVLPPFGDDALVKELLTQTMFISSYGTAWKENGSLKTFAPSAGATLSIVPNNYEAGIIEVSDTSCMRCHKNTGDLLASWHKDIYSYGEIWGKDNIFSFQPFDEDLFPFLNNEKYPDNRRMNPKLKSMGIIEEFNPSKHQAPTYNFSN